jgi:CYTH domain-containing protein
MVDANPLDNREIERKYLLRALPASDRLATATSLEIDQGYLPGVRIIERLRRTRGPDGVKYYRTMKFGSGMDRTELEDETTEEFFLATWPFTRGARVRKRRYLVPEGDVVWEIDEFLDRPDLWLAEVELDHVDHAVPIPDWLAPVVVREVTFEKGYSNRALAR